jgi:hypothetical protein
MIGKQIEKTDEPYLYPSKHKARELARFDNLMKRYIWYVKRITCLRASLTNNEKVFACHIVSFIDPQPI